MANSSVLTVNLQDAGFRDLVTHLSPAHLRIGGSEGDYAVYQTPDALVCPKVNLTGNFCLSMDRWDELNAFAQQCGVSILFGLNALTGRSNDNAHQNQSALASFIRYNAAKNYSSLRAFEYGNEKEEFNATTYAADYASLRGILNDAYAATPAHLRPLLIGPDININNKWDQVFWRGAMQSINATTYHLYIGYGLDNNLPKQAWNATFLKVSGASARGVVAAAKAVNLSVPLWVGETALAWHSGRNGTTNSFSSGPWMMTQYGALAQLGHKVQCRQTLRGGYYELIDKFTSKPNPDYWLSVLWKRTMGVSALNVSLSSAPGDASDLFVYAHCTSPAGGGGLTLAYANLSPSVTYSLTVASTTQPGASFPSVPRNEYILTSGDGNVSSSLLALNGVLIDYNGPGTFPTLPPRTVTDPSLSAIVLPPLSYGFIAFALATGGSGC